MRSVEASLRKGLAICLMIFLAAPLGAPAVAQQSAPTQQTGVTPPPQPAPQDSGSQPVQSMSQPTGASQPDRPQPAQTPQQGGNPPVGTAAAPFEKGVGVAASRPAGVVIAPAKQRRTRSFLIRVGLIVGAAVAIGTVVALSNTSPSRPH
jgi:hypothetical protein